MKRFLPLFVFLAIVALAAWRLAVPGEDKVKSQLVGQPVPAFAVPRLFGDQPGLDSATLRGPVMINLFASWCVPCIAEAPLLEAMAKEGVVIDGIAVRDTRKGVADFFAANGNPYRAIGDDAESLAMIAFGASGVPETFIVDSRGRITYHHQGPILAQDVPQLMAEWEKVR